MPALRSLLGDSPEPRVLCFGAHSDDIEIGCGGTLLALAGRTPGLTVRWVVLSGPGERAGEARRSAAALLDGRARVEVSVHEFRDGFFPDAWAAIKETFEGLKSEPDPEVVFTHWGEDRHQDHRVVSELTWNTFRGRPILEYEIPKWDGDLGRPNVFVPLSRDTVRTKAQHLAEHFPSQRSKPWFQDEVFTGLARIRGMECDAPEGYAEAFHARKITLA